MEITYAFTRMYLEYVFERYRKRYKSIRTLHRFSINNVDNSVCAWITFNFRFQTSVQGSSKHSTRKRYLRMCNIYLTTIIVPYAIRPKRYDDIL